MIVWVIMEQLRCPDTTVNLTHHSQQFVVWGCQHLSRPRGILLQRCPPKKGLTIFHACQGVIFIPGNYFTIHINMKKKPSHYKYKGTVLLHCVSNHGYVCCLFSETFLPQTDSVCFFVLRHKNL